MTFNRSAIMKRAWEIFRERNHLRSKETIRKNFRMLMSVALTLAWEDAKREQMTTDQLHASSLQHQLTAATFIDNFAEMRREVRRLTTELRAA